MLFTLPLTVAGCGSSDDTTAVVTTTSNRGPLTIQTHRGTVDSTQSTNIASSVNRLRLTGLDSSGAVVFGPQEFLVSELLNLELSLAVTQLRIELLSNGTVVASGTVPTALVANQTFNIQNPVFTYSTIPTTNPTVSPTPNPTVTPPPVVVPPSADLALTGTVDNATPKVNDTINLSLTLTNMGPSNATAVQVSAPLPAGYTLVTATPESGSYNNGIWTLNVAAGEAKTLTLAVTVDTAAVKTFTGAISVISVPDPQPNNNSVSLVQTPQQSDLAITATTSPASPTVGDNVTFTVTASNLGPNTAGSVSIEALLPSGFTFVSATPSTGTYTPGTGVWQVGTLASNASQTLTLVGTAQSGDVDYTLEASVSNSDNSDPVTGNNSASATSAVGQVDLEISNFSVSNPSPAVAEEVTATVAVVNNGPNTAGSGTVVVTLPSNATYVANSGGTYDAGSGTVTFSLTNVPVSATPTNLTFRYTSTNTNAVNLTVAVSGPTFDTDGTNNSGTTSSTATDADLSLALSISDATPSAGESVTLTVTLSNDGNRAAADSTVTVILPAGFVFVSAVPLQGSYNPANGEWTAGTVAAGDSTSLQINGTVTTATPLSYTGTASTTTFETNTNNNSDTTP